MKIRHATLLNVIGRPAKHGGMTIVPAELELEGTALVSSFPLREMAVDQVPSVLRLPIKGGFDVAWVRARLPNAFGISPQQSEAEKSLLWVGFVAVIDGEDGAVPFECSDYYGKTSLTFSPAEEDSALVCRVSQAFWEILLSEPDELVDFEARVRHLGAPITMVFGCEHGEPFYDEIED